MKIFGNQTEDTAGKPVEVTITNVEFTLGEPTSNKRWIGCYNEYGVYCNIDVKAVKGLKKGDMFVVLMGKYVQYPDSPVIVNRLM